MERTKLFNDEMITLNAISIINVIGFIIACILRKKIEMYELVIFNILGVILSLMVIFNLSNKLDTCMSLYGKTMFYCMKKSMNRWIRLCVTIMSILTVQCVIIAYLERIL